MNLERIQLKGQLAEAKSEYRNLDVEASGLVILIRSFEEAFFYCDPPYSKGCGYEVTSTENFDHELLRRLVVFVFNIFISITCVAIIKCPCK